MILPRQHHPDHNFSPLTLYAHLSPPAGHQPHHNIPSQIPHPRRGQDILHFRSTEQRLAQVPSTHQMEQATLPTFHQSFCITSQNLFRILNIPSARAWERFPLTVPITKDQIQIFLLTKRLVSEKALRYVSTYNSKRLFYNAGTDGSHWRGKGS